MAGEGPINQTTPALTAYGNRYLATAAPTIHSEAATFALPPDLVSSGRTHRLTEETLVDNCMEAHVITFNKNPYIYVSEEQANKVDLPYKPADLTH